MREFAPWLQEMRAEHEEKLAAIHVDWAEYRHEMAAAIQASEARLVERIHSVEVTLGDRMQGVETRLGERIGKVDVRVADVKADLMMWSFVFWVGAVTAIAMLAGVLR